MLHRLPFSPANYNQIDHFLLYDEELQELESSINNLSQNSTMVEWGSGASTIRWLEIIKSDCKLISIEHNQEWYNKVNDYIKSRPDLNCKQYKYLYKPARKFDHTYGTIVEESPFGMDDYLIPDLSILEADMFFIDGVSRATIALIIKAFSKKFDPIIYLHDYYGRQDWYDWAIQFFAKKEKVGRTLLRLWK